VVGALFFTVLMVSGFSVLSLALDAQTDIVTTQRVVSDIELKKQQERFGIAVSTDTNNMLDVSVTNLGQNPVGIESFWIINKTMVTEPAKRFEINYNDSFVSGGASTQILTSQPLYMIPDTYDIKVVSSLGTIEIVELDVGSGGSSSNSLQSVLLANPPDIILGQNVTLAMVVTNVGKLTIEDVTPSSPSMTPSASIITPLPSDPPSVDLLSGESMVFVWDYKTNAASAVDSDIDFSIFATGLDVNNNFVQSNTALDSSTLREDVTGNTNPPIVLTQDLLSRPEIFLTFPSPMGDGTTINDKGLWGANIVNPTAHDMVVSKLVITLLSPRANNNDQMFSISGSPDICNPVETVAPTSDDWSCPEDNQLVWKGNPVTIPPFSVYPFNARVNADKLDSPEDTLSSVIVHANVFTTVGQFGKAGYGSSFDNDQDKQAIPSVYLSSLVNSVNSNYMLSSKTGIASGSVTTFNVVLADLDAGTLNGIDDSSRLIINIPKGWVVDESSIDGYGDFTTSYQPFVDSSSQIIGELNADLVSGGVTVTFDATAPTVTNTQMYVMYLLADGHTDNALLEDEFAIGPLQEAILQVVPP
jgi:hypothetical protein